MENKPSGKTVTIKGAFWDGILLDLLILVIASTIMDGGETAMRCTFLVIAHLMFSVWLVLHKKRNLSRYELDFIRFGILLLIVIAIITRSVLVFLGLTIIA